MSDDPTGILAYGFGLGSRDDISTDQLPWFVEDDGIVESAEKALLASVGFTETWTKGDKGYFDRKRDAEKRLGVEIVWTGTWDYPGFVLAATKQEVEWSEVKPIDLAVPDGADEKLRRAIAALPGLKLVNDEPGWLLAAFYG